MENNSSSGSCTTTALPTAADPVTNNTDGIDDAPKNTIAAKRVQDVIKLIQFVVGVKD
jgi:hypothetical protein